MKQKLPITVFQSDEMNYKIPDRPDEFMEFWKSKIDMIPSEFMDSARIDIDASSGYDCGVLSVAVYYTREETDSEERDRIERKSFADKATEKRERRVLAELLEKYGNQ